MVAYWPQATFKGIVVSILNQTCNTEMLDDKHIVVTHWLRHKDKTPKLLVFLMIPSILSTSDSSAFHPCVVSMCRLLKLSRNRSKYYYI